MNYHADIVWEIDKCLFVLCLALAGSVVLYAAVKEFREGRKARRLECVRRNLLHFVLSDQNGHGPHPAAWGREVTPLDFMELLKNEKQSVSLEMTEKLGQYFADPAHLAKAIDVARKSKNKWRRIEALISLGYVGAAAAIDVVRSSLKDKDRDVAYFSMLALGKMRTREAARILVAAIGDRILSGERIVSFLKDFPPFVVDEAAEAMGSQDPLVRFWAVKLLTHFRPQHLSKNIEKLASDPSSQVRAAVCECLGKRGDRGSADAVRPRLHDSVWFVRRQAIKALSRLIGAECIPEIKDFLMDENVMVRDGAKKAMTHDIIAALPYLERGLSEGPPLLKKNCVEVLEISGYLNVLFSDLLFGDAQAKDKARSLLKGVLNAGAHWGIEGLLARYEPVSSEKILNIIEEIDGSVADHMRKKIRHLIEEI